MDSAACVPKLLALPAEIINQILSYLAPRQLVKASATCKLLHEHAICDLLWQPLVNHNLPDFLSSPAPLSSFRELYIAHHPYWFLPRHKIWISDAEPGGKLLVARYDPSRGCIEAYAVVAQRGPHTYQLWSHDSNVAVHSFHPQVQLDLNQPVLKLNANSPRAQVNETSSAHLHGAVPRPRTTTDSSDSNEDHLPRLAREILMDTSAPAGLCTTFLLARDHPSILTMSSTAVWPPLTIPAPSRTRNASSNGYQSSGHRPTKHSEVSQNTFRLRKWVEFHGRRANTSSLANLTGFERLSAALGLGFVPSASSISGLTSGMTIRMGEEVATYGTLSTEAYTPTPDKPWRGIWCGDYSAHGCEFLVILQPEIGTEGALPEGMDWMREWLRTGRGYSESSRDGLLGAAEDISQFDPDDDDDEELEWNMESVPEDVDRQRAASADPGSSDAQSNIYSGRLEAIKLTGDINIPRGQYTFIAPDIGEKGFVRDAREPMFQGARVVRSAGHIAGRGFNNDEYMASQLIMISKDRLAQYWEGFGHISFYQRVDLDALMKL